MMTEPRCRVVPDDRYETRYAQPNIKSLTYSSCLVSESTIVRRSSFPGSPPTTSGRTRHGPSGAKVSNPLENPYCGTLPAKPGSLWSFLDETSLPHVYAAT